MGVYWLAEFLQKLESHMAPAEQEYVQAMLGIVSRHGKLANSDGNGIWVGYTPAEENDNSEIGVKCGNCAFYQGDNICRIVAQQVEEEGVCRLAAIPDDLVKGGSKDE